MANARIIRTRVGERPCRLLETAEFLRQILELPDPFLHGVHLAVEHITHVGTRCLSLVPQAENLADVVQSDAE